MNHSIVLYYVSFLILSIEICGAIVWAINHCREYWNELDIDMGKSHRISLAIHGGYIVLVLSVYAASLVIMYQMALHYGVVG